ncbi:MAG: universal stress protein [Candidatus Bathyarchaeia archaeon]
MSVGEPPEKAIEEQIRVFERAIAKIEELELPEINRILLVLDHSDLDELVLGFGGRLAERVNAKVFVTYAYKKPDPRKMGYLKRRIGELRKALPRKVFQAQAAGKPFEKILKVAEMKSVDLIIIPILYLEDKEALRGAGMGETIEALLNKVRIPVLVVKETPKDVGKMGQSLILVATEYTKGLLRAGGYALAVAEEKGKIYVHAVSKKDVIAKVCELLGEECEVVEIKEVTDTLSKMLRGFILSLKRVAKPKGIRIWVKFMVAHDVAKKVILRGEEAEALIVTDSMRTPEGLLGEFPRELVTLSKSSVLVV